MTGLCTFKYLTNILRNSTKIIFLRATKNLKELSVAQRKCVFSDEETSNLKVIWSYKKQLKKKESNNISLCTLIILSVWYLY